VVGDNTSFKTNIVSYVDYFFKGGLTQENKEIYIVVLNIFQNQVVYRELEHDNSCVEMQEYFLQESLPGENDVYNEYFYVEEDISENFQEAPNSIHKVLGIQEEFDYVFVKKLLS